MIVGNQAWLNALADPAKQPLYVFEIADYGLILASFTNTAGVVLGGYGVVPYGIGGYGT
jgi:hypothetical protein